MRPRLSSRRPQGEGDTPTWGRSSMSSWLWRLDSCNVRWLFLSLGPVRRSDWLLGLEGSYDREHKEKKVSEDIEICFWNSHPNRPKILSFSTQKRFSVYKKKKVETDSSFFSETKYLCTKVRAKFADWSFCGTSPGVNTSNSFLWCNKWEILLWDKKRILSGTQSLNPFRRFS